MRKGEQTKRAILDAAIELASSRGLEGLTIGDLAERMNMSKSGVFAHCGSREELQIAVLREYESRFIDDILKPSVLESRGLNRLRAILKRWLARAAAEALHGCIMISGAAEYDDRPGPVRDELVRMVRSWQAEVGKAISQCKASGELIAELDEADLCFELFGLVFAVHHDARLLRNPGSLGQAERAIERLINSYSTQPGLAPSASANPKSSNPTDSQRPTVSLASDSNPKTQ
ncbi:MAG: TetR/AcrR family transcriptional regulator [Burkholderiaceae bacterium]